jgi:hypothetical protein
MGMGIENKEDKKNAIGKREFMKSLTCQILSISPDINTGLVSVDVRVTKL